MSTTEDDFIEYDEPVDVTIEYTFDDDQTVFWKPPLVTNLTENNVGDSEAVVDGCGNRERRSPDTASWQVDIEGICLRPDVNVLRELNLANKEVSIATEMGVHSNVTIDDVEISMEEGQPKGRFPHRPITDFTRQHTEERQALTQGLIFSFQIQSEDPSEEDGGGGFFG